MKNDIPILNPNDLTSYHFGDLELKIELASFHNHFHINKIEDTKDKIKFPLPPHRKTVFDFIFLTKGSSIRSKGLHTYTFGENTFFFLPAFQISTHELVSADAEGYFCHFDLNIFDVNQHLLHVIESFSFLKFHSSPIVKVDKSIVDFVLKILHRLEIEYSKKELKNFDIVSAYLFTLFTEVSQFVVKDDFITKNAAYIITENFKNYLTQYIYQKQKVSEYSDLMAISTNHLSRSVKAVTGKSAQELLNEMLLLESKVLLRQSGLPINEVAFKLSERNASDFSRFFKSKEGISPKEYRKMHDIA